MRSETLGFGIVVVNLYRRAWADFCVTTVHGSDDVRKALVGSTYGWDSWRPLLDDCFLRCGAYFIRQGDFDWSNHTGNRYVPKGRVSQDPRAWHPDDELFVPLYGEGEELLGVLSVGDPASGLRPTDEELQLLVGLAGHAANALAAARASIERRRHSAALERLMHISSELTQSLAPASILQSVCDGIAAALGFQKVCAQLLAEDGNSLVTRAVAGWSPDDSIVQKTLSLGEISALFDPEFERAGCYLVPNEVARARVSTSQVVYESSSNGRGPHAWNHHWLAIPLHGASGETIGLIWADEPEDRLLPTEEWLQALRVFANQAASALTLATQFEQMSYLADHDPLTHLPNRRAFMRELESALVEAEADGSSLALIVVDVDGLKALNDRRGHAAGDECLIRIGELLRSGIDAADAAFRIGGDEFAILLPGFDLQAATATSLRLAESLERQ